jgi:hypothetical protein
MCYDGCIQYQVLHDAGNSSRQGSWGSCDFYYYFFEWLCFDVLIDGSFESWIQNRGSICKVSS